VGHCLADLPLGMGRQAEESGSEFDLQQIVDLPRAEMDPDLRTRGLVGRRVVPS
jgi:hypothetical protein